MQFPPPLYQSTYLTVIYLFQVAVIGFFSLSLAIVIVHLAYNNNNFNGDTVTTSDDDDGNNVRASTAWLGLAPFSIAMALSMYWALVAKVYLRRIKSCTSSSSSGGLIRGREGHQSHCEHLQKHEDDSQMLLVSTNKCTGDNNSSSNCGLAEDKKKADGGGGNRGEEGGKIYGDSGRASSLDGKIEPDKKGCSALKAKTATDFTSDSDFPFLFLVPKNFSTH